MAFRFREWRIYQESRIFRRFVLEEVGPRLPSDEKFILADQLKRALLSVVLNIAEGSFRRSDRELSRFLEVAIASLHEVIACLDCTVDDGYMTNQEAEKISERAENLAKQVSAFRRTLKATSPSSYKL